MKSPVPGGDPSPTFPLRALQGKIGEGAIGGYALRGSTIMRPPISMWSAWQNHWQ